MSRLRIEGLLGPGVDVDRLRVGDGECVALFGPSGGGKTRLLRAIADLDEAAGAVWLDDERRDDMGAPAWRRRVVYVAAESAWWHPRVRAHADRWDTRQLSRLGFEPDVLDWEIARLSSGERQRLAVARALSHEPAALLLDEPSANLDGPNTEHLEGLIADWRTAGGCVLWVSHDAAQRERIATRSYAVTGGRLLDPPGD